MGDQAISGSRILCRTFARYHKEIDGVGGLLPPQQIIIIVQATDIKAGTSGITILAEGPRGVLVYLITAQVGFA
jgi:hypothetical protein